MSFQYCPVKIYKGDFSSPYNIIFLLNLNPVYLVIKSTTPSPEGILGMFHFIKRGNKKIIYLA